MLLMVKDEPAMLPRSTTADCRRDSFCCSASMNESWNCWRKAALGFLSEDIQVSPERCLDRSPFRVSSSRRACLHVAVPAAAHAHGSFHRGCPRTTTGLIET